MTKHRVPTLVKLGTNIRVLRKNKNLTQVKLAFLSDIHPNHIAKIEQGRINCTLLVLKKISISLNCTVCDLLCGI